MTSLRNSAATVQAPLPIDRRPTTPVTGGTEGSVRLYRAAVCVLMLLGATLWLGRLSSSSLFTDEALSWHDAGHSLSTLIAGVRRYELNPLGYYLFLHGWIVVSHSTSEWWLRLPSAIAGVGLVGVLAWFTSLAAGRVQALIAGLLAVVSPFFFDYAQEARAYVFVMLAVTIAAAALLQAERSERSQNRWVVVSLVAAALGLAGHYTAALVLLPLAAYLIRWSPLPKRARVGWVVGVAVAGLIWTPLLVEQWGSGHNGWLNSFANLTQQHFGDVFGGPFSGRIFQPPSRAMLGAAIVLGAAALVLLTSRKREIRLVVALALAPPIALLLATLAGHPALLTRYVAVAVPFTFAMLAIGLVRLPTLPRTALLAGMLVLSLWNVRAADEPAGRYMDMRTALSYIRAGYHRTDAVGVVGSGGVVFDLEYYVPRLVPSGGKVVLVSPNDQNLSHSRLRAALRAHRPIWLVNTDLPYRPRFPAGYAATAVRLFPGIRWVEVIHAQPRIRAQSSRPGA